MFKFFFVTRLQIIDVLLRLDVFIVAIMNINSPFRIKKKKKRWKEALLYRGVV